MGYYYISEFAWFFVGGIGYSVTEPTSPRWYATLSSFSRVLMTTKDWRYFLSYWKAQLLYWAVRYLKTWCFIFVCKRRCVRSSIRFYRQMGRKALWSILSRRRTNSGIEPHILVMKCVNWMAVCYCVWVFYFAVVDSVGFFLLKVNTIEIKSHASEKEVAAAALRRDFPFAAPSGFWQPTYITGRSGCSSLRICTFAPFHIPLKSH